MSSVKYWVRGGGRWREIELDSGRVSGWGVASFVYVSRGKLVKGDKWRILRALRALAKGDTRGAARDGPRLTLKRSSVDDPPRKRKRFCRHHHHCCSSPHTCHNQVNHIPNSSVLSALSSPTKITANAVVQTDAKEIDNKITAEIHSRPSKRRHLVISSDESEPPKGISRKKTKSSNYDRIVRELSDDTAEEPENVRELFIEEEDILTMRSCIERGIFPNYDLLKFDSSEIYQKQVIHKLNPLVLVNRCPKIARMLRLNENYRDDVSLDLFISKLGLRHVRDVKERKRYLFRNTISRKQNAPEDYTRKNDENDKENRSSKPMPKSHKRNLSLKRKEHKIGSATVAVNTTPSLDKNRLTNVTDENLLPNRLRVQNRSFTISSDSNTESDRPVSSLKRLKTVHSVETEVPNRLKDQNQIESDADSFKNQKSSPSKQARPNEMQKKIRVNKPSVRVNKPKVPVKKLSGREYSPAEDRAIVNWVQAGSRARKVNGNQLWRQLEPLYFDITGHVRSWHSLRNRYLRYILPALQSLAPPHAAALRAAAAAGENKIGRRRHSMFSPPRFGAASRKHAGTAGSKSPLRQLRSSLPDEAPTERSTQSLDNSEKILRTRSPHNKSLNELDMARSQMSKTSTNKTKRRSIRVGNVNDADTSVSPKKVKTAETSKPKRRRLYNP